MSKEKGIMKNIGLSAHGHGMKTVLNVPEFRCIDEQNSSSYSVTYMKS